MPTRVWGVINIAPTANAANEAASAAADVIGSPAAVKILGSMISLPSSFVFFHNLISLPGRKAAEEQRRRATTLQPAPLASTFKDIRRATRRHFSAEDKIRIVVEGLRGEANIAEHCRREGIVQNLYLGLKP